VQKNLTLTVDESLLRAARKVAIDRKTSVNQLVREFLVRLAHESGSPQATLAQLDETFRSSRIQIGTADWTREDLHERNRATVDIGPIVSVIAHAVAVFGDEHKASHWLETPLPLLDNRSPSQILVGGGGIDRVEQILTRIEHNTPS